MQKILCCSILYVCQFLGFSHPIISVCLILSTLHADRENSIQKLSSKNYMKIYIINSRRVYQSLGFFHPIISFLRIILSFLHTDRKNFIQKNLMKKKFILHKFIPKFILFHPICLSNFSIFFTILYVYSICLFFWKCEV